MIADLLEASRMGLKIAVPGFVFYLLANGEVQAAVPLSILVFLYLFTATKLRKQKEN